MSVLGKWYEKRVLPHLTDIVMRNREIARYRARIVPSARRVVLEVGVGTGLICPCTRPKWSACTRSILALTCFVSHADKREPRA